MLTCTKLLSPDGNSLSCMIMCNMSVKSLLSPEPHLMFFLVYLVIAIPSLQMAKPTLFTYCNSFIDLQSNYVSHLTLWAISHFSIAHPPHCCFHYTVLLPLNSMVFKLINNSLSIKATHFSRKKFPVCHSYVAIALTFSNGEF